MGRALIGVFLVSLKITAFVFVMMLLTDLLNVKTAGAVGRLLRGGRWRQYVLASFLGATPGCFGAFLAAYLYAHGFLSFGAIVAAMVATSGDESFVMLQAFPARAVLLHVLLFLLGIGAGWASDGLVPLLRLRRAEACPLSEPCAACPGSKAREQPSPLAVEPVEVGGEIGRTHDPEGVEEEGGFWHFLKEHLLGHIVRRHLWRIFLWTFVALLVVKFTVKEGPLSAFVKGHMGWTLLPIAALVGLAPESGPHMIFVFLYRDGLAPFSVLLTSSIVQDGHGMLPLFGFCPKDAVLVKAFNFALGLAVGGLLLLAGL